MEIVKNPGLLKSFLGRKEAQGKGSRFCAFSIETVSEQFLFENTGAENSKSRLEAQQIDDISQDSRKIVDQRRQLTTLFWLDKFEVKLIKLFGKGGTPHLSHLTPRPGGNFWAEKYLALNHLAIHFLNHQLLKL